MTASLQGIAPSEVDKNDTRYRTTLKTMQKFKSSLFIKQNVSDLKWEDVHPNKFLIGSGSFSTVYKVKVQNLKSNEKRETTRRSANNYYALKSVQFDMVHGQEDSAFMDAAIDLILEAKLLQCLHHPNLIQVHGVMKGCVSEACTDGRYLVVMDLLQETLQDRIERWQKQKGMSVFPKLRFRTKQNAHTQRARGIALGIASGMEYLHQHMIMHRDVKPNNIGFDASDDQVRIFDLGLARQVDKDQELQYTVGAGTLRYLSPESALGDAYGLSTDVYSFGLLLWELCTLQRPFSNLKSIDQFHTDVYTLKRRPPTHQIGCQLLRQLVQDCWNHDPTARPSFSSIRHRLEHFEKTQRSATGKTSSM